MILLFAVMALVFLAVRVVALCVAAVAAVCDYLAKDDVSVAAGHAANPADAAPQDAPPHAPWPPVTGPQDARGYPQDAPLGHRVGEPAETGESAPPAPTLREVLALVAAAVVATRSHRTSLTASAGADGRRVLTLVVDPVPAPGMPVDPEVPEPADPLTLLLDALPRPASGPAYLGGRDDDAYLRGWDDGVDWVREGNPERAPSWSSAAYMTGWNDSLRAATKLRCAA